MFEVGFSEMVVIAVVALIVIGPERLPGVTRTLGHLLGRLNRYVSSVKADINREMELEELRKFKDQFQGAAQEVQNTIHQELGQAGSALDGLAAEAGAISTTTTAGGEGSQVPVEALNAPADSGPRTQA